MKLFLYWVLEMQSVFLLSESYENFKFIDDLAENLKKLNKKSINHNLIISENIDYIFLLLHHPDKDVQKKGKYLLRSIEFNKKYTSKSIDLELNLDVSELELYYQYIIHFLAVKNTDLFLKTVKLIQTNKKKFEPYLIEALVNENEAIGLNAAKLLHIINDDKFESPNFYNIMKNLSQSEKTKLLKKLDKKIVNLPNMNWKKRESIVRMLISLEIPNAVSKIQEFVSDPDENIRYNIAASLPNFQTPLVENLLIKLLLDEEDKIRFKAADSLGVLFPSLYKNQSPQNILQIFGTKQPKKLLSLMDSLKFNKNIQKMWKKLGYDSEFIQKFYSASDLILIEKYIEYVVLLADNSLKNTINFLISDRMPRILEIISKEIKNEENLDKKKYLLRTYQDIQNLFTIKQRDGFILLL